MRIDPDVIEASRPDDREIALLAAEVRRLQAVINSEEPAAIDEEQAACPSPMLTAEEREAIDRVAFWLDQHGWRKDVDTLLALLERTK